MNKLRTLPAGLAVGMLLALPAWAADAPLDAQSMQGNKTVLMETDYPSGYTTRIVKTVVPADAKAPLHEHPGIESGYILSGGGTLYVEGQEQRAMAPGQTALVPPYTPHWFQNGHAETVIVSTYVLEQGKPAMTVLKKP